MTAAGTERTCSFGLRKPGLAGLIKACAGAVPTPIRQRIGIRSASWRTLSKTKERAPALSVTALKTCDQGQTGFVTVDQRFHPWSKAAPSLGFCTVNADGSIIVLINARSAAALRLQAWFSNAIKSCSLGR